jgi:hypothetical protein
VSTFLKCKCPHCAIEIEFDSDDAGRSCNCPSCGNALQLPIPSANLINETKPVTSPPQVVYAPPQTVYVKEKPKTGCLTQIVAFFFGIFLLVIIIGSCNSINNTPTSQTPPTPAAKPKPTINNEVDNSMLLNTATNKVDTAAEQQLLAAFPQLLWSRAKLEFGFEMRAEIGSALTTGANSDDEAFKWAKKMEAVFPKGDDTKMFTEGWKMSGQIHSDTVNFTKEGYTLSGITVEIQLLFYREKLISLSFWTDGSDRDFANLYQVLVRACNSPGQRTVSSKDDSQINWTIVGSANRYDIDLSKQIWILSDSVKVDRGMTIIIK